MPNPASMESPKPWGLPHPLQWPPQILHLPHPDHLPPCNSCWRLEKSMFMVLFFLFFLLNFFIGNRGCGGPPAPSSPAAFPPPFWAGKSSFIPAGASPASVCIGCGHPTWQDGAQGADGHGGGVSSPCPPMRRTSHVHRGASGRRASPGTTPSPIKKCRPPAVSWWLPFLPLASLWVPC